MLSIYLDSSSAQLWFISSHDWSDEEVSSSSNSEWTVVQWMEGKKDEKSSNFKSNDNFSRVLAAYKFNLHGAGVWWFLIDFNAWAVVSGVIWEI